MVPLCQITVPSDLENVTFPSSPIVNRPSVQFKYSDLQSYTAALPSAGASKDIVFNVVSGPHE